jgi:hypothetical protein
MQFCRMCYYNVYGCHKPVALLVLVVVFHSFSYLLSPRWLH